MTFAIAEGETLSLVGESGCGKSTVGQAILRCSTSPPARSCLARPAHRRPRCRRDAPHRRRVQVVFQDPYSSLNPRMRVRDIVAEPIRNFGLATSRADRRNGCCAVRPVGLRADQMPQAVRILRRPAAASRHRAGAGAEPELIVCDEPVSALDVSVQAQVVNLLQDLQREFGLSLLFIATISPSSST